MLHFILEYGTTIKNVTMCTWARNCYKKCYLAYLVDLEKYPNPPNTPLYCKTLVPVSQVPPVLEYGTTIKNVLSTTMVTLKTFFLTWYDIVNILLIDKNHIYYQMGQVCKMLYFILGYGTTIKNVTLRTWEQGYYKKCNLAYLSTGLL